ncbi:MAG: putative O-glycosylation ligase, exosortase A system-associated [Magnetococcales bacterium]|nr:putative O-glycosylation ligase, exosortase A system-associated [Magnetococcales bacterium]
MRDLLLTLFIFALLPVALFRPYVGLLLWAWISYMNPHRLTWGFAYNFRFNMLIALVTLISILYATRLRFNIPWRTTTVLNTTFLGWTLITTYNALQYSSAITQLDRFVKIQIMLFITLIVVKTRRQILILVGLIAFSIGFYGVKGGFFAITSGGKYRVMGPGGSFFVDNNSLALALLMIIPLIYFFFLNTKKIYLRLLLLGSAALCLLAVLATYSRGGLVGLSILSIAFLLMARKKLLIIGLVAIVGPSIYNFMPDSWHHRMQIVIQSSLDSILYLEKINQPLAEPRSIQKSAPSTSNPNTSTPARQRAVTGLVILDFLLHSDSSLTQDKSVQGRLDAWVFCLKLANERPILGGGFETFDQGVYDLIMPGTQRRAPHNIFFEVLAEHGYVGLILWLSIHISAFINARKIISLSKRDPALLWARDLANMFQLSLISYYSAGIFLGMAVFDLPFHLIIISQLVRTHVENHISKPTQTPVSAPIRFQHGKPFPWQAGSRLPLTAPR